MFGRALTSTLWGMVADRIGRKPVIVFGILLRQYFYLIFISYFLHIEIFVAIDFWSQRLTAHLF